MSLGADLRTLAIYEFELERAARRPKAHRRISGTCAYCGVGGADLVVDHDHETRRVRGVVHRSCNAKIASHTASNVYQLVEYLNRRPNLGFYPRMERG